MEITRDVIQDLLPLYLSGEASADTCALVEGYLETDPELAEVAKQATPNDLSEVPVPLSKEVEMQAFEQAKKWMVIRTLGLAVIITTALISILLIVPLIIIFVTKPC